MNLHLHPKLKKKRKRKEFKVELWKITNKFCSQPASLSPASKRAPELERGQQWRIDGGRGRRRRLKIFLVTHKQ